MNNDTKISSWYDSGMVTEVNIHGGDQITFENHVITETYFEVNSHKVHIRIEPPEFVENCHLIANDLDSKDFENAEMRLVEMESKYGSNDSKLLRLRSDLELFKESIFK